MLIVVIVFFLKVKVAVSCFLNCVTVALLFFFVTAEGRYGHAFLMVSQDRPKMSKDGPKRAPREPNMNPRWAPDAPREPQEGLKKPKMGPRWAQVGPKMGPK